MVSPVRGTKEKLPILVISGKIEGSTDIHACKCSSYRPETAFNKNTAEKVQQWVSPRPNEDSRLGQKPTSWDLNLTYHSKSQNYRLLPAPVNSKDDTSHGPPLVRGFVSVAAPTRVPHCCSLWHLLLCAHTSNSAQTADKCCLVPFCCTVVTSGQCHQLHVHSAPCPNVVGGKQDHVV